MLDLSAMKGLEIDAERRTAWAETGLTAGEYTAAAAAHGLATGFGDAGSVGIGGITLAGGIGFLVRKHGMTIDDLLAAEIVTAEGERLRVDADHHADLFWALRGGGGNFGVATRLQFRLHEVDTIVGGMLFLPATPDVIAGFLAEAEAAPEELSTIANVMPAPPLPFVPPEVHGRPVITAMLVHAGDVEAGERAIAPFRALAEPVVDMLRPMHYAEMYRPPEANYRPVAVGRTFFADSVDRDAAATILDRIESSTAAPRWSSSASSAARWRACPRTRPRSRTASGASSATLSRCTARRRSGRSTTRGSPTSPASSAAATPPLTRGSSATWAARPCGPPTRARPGSGWRRSRAPTTRRTSSG